MIKFAISGKIDTREIKIIMISEALPKNKEDYFYSSSKTSLYVVNTLSAFNNAGFKVVNIDSIVEKGVYFTVAIKESRKGSTVPTEIIKKYSHILEEELEMFPNAKAIILMGDAAIKALNIISQRITGKRVIPGGSTYKIRVGKFYYKNIRVFPSYLQTGKNFLIEKSKQKMVSEDIKNAFKLIQN